MSLEAERIVLAATALTDAGYDYAVQHLSAADFVDDDCRAAWPVVLRMRESGTPVDAVTLGAALDASDDWAARDDGLMWAVRLLDDAFVTVPPQKHVESYVELLRSATMSRQLHAYARDVHEIADGELSADEKVSAVHAAIADVASGTQSGFRELREYLTEAVEDMQRRNDVGGIIGQTTGWDALDELTNGMDAADMIVLAARPSMGKSACAMNIAQHVAKSKPVLVFSLEMPGKALMERMISATGPVDMTEIRKGLLQDWTRYTAAVTQIRELPLRIDDTGGLSIEQLRLRARMAARKATPGLIVIDYLQQLEVPGASEFQAVTIASRQVKAMAKEIGCPVLVLSQLNRAVETRGGDKRPQMADLRQSGQIEQDADQVWMLYRDEVYDDDTPRKGIAEVIVRKARNGTLGTVFLEWEGKHQRFMRMTGPVPEIEQKQSRRSLSSFTKGNKHAAAY